MRVFGAVIFAAAAATSPLQAQQHVTIPPPRAAVVPEAITVGDVFHAAIRIEAPPGVRVVFPDTLAIPADMEAAGRRSIRVDTVEGGLAYTALYPLTAWRPDTILLPGARIDVLAEGAQQAHAVEFPVFAVRSVLPADTAGIQPKPPKDVLGANRLLWPFLLALALLLAVLALLYWAQRRRRVPEQVAAPIPAVPPRQRALAALDAARAAGLIEAGAMKEFYTRVSDALRQYVDALDARWGADLTTSELARQMRGRGRDREITELLVVLEEADLVKFARRRPEDVQALSRWASARRFVEQFELPAAPPEARAA